MNEPSNVNDVNDVNDPSDVSQPSDSLSAGVRSPMSTVGPNLMMRGVVAVLVLVVVSGVIWVLSSPSDTELPGGTAVPVSESGEVTETLASRNPFISTNPPRKTLEGNWVLIISQPNDETHRFDEICSGLFILSPRRGDLDDMTVRIAYRTQVFPDAKLDKTATRAGRKHIRIVFRQGLHQLDFDGTLSEDGIVYGNLVRGDTCLAARLMATDEAKLDSQIAVMSTLDRPKLDAVMNKAKSRKLSLFDSYRMFCDEHPETSLALDISLRNLMIHAVPKQLPLKEYRAAVESHLKLASRWGPRMKNINTLVLGHVMFAQGYPPSAAVSVTEGLADAFGEESWGVPFQRRLDELHYRCRITQGRNDAEELLKQLAAKSTTDRDTPLAKLREIREQFPYSHFVTFGLAEEAEKAKRMDEAIELYGEVVALPLMERLLEFEWASVGFKAVRPGDTLAKLWKAKHGDTTGLTAYIETTYAKAIADLAKSTEVSVPEAPGRSVLCELFTSVRADAAVAAEMSTAALARRLGSDRFIVIRYHPLDVSSRNQGNGDPLANDASLARLAYYRSRTFPAVYMDGRLLPGTDGLLADTSRVHERFVRETVRRLEIGSDWSVELEARRTGDSIQVTAKAQSDKLAEGEYRLRLMLVEEQIPMPTSSCGIRVQEMVMRWQIAGADGVAPKDGKFAVTETVSLPDVRKLLTDDLARFERLQGMNFPDKPLDLKSLFVIAVVQDETTREVLQAKLVPVTASPASAKPASAKPSPAKPSPAKPSPAKPSPAKPAPAKPASN